MKTGFLVLPAIVGLATAGVAAWSTGIADQQPARSAERPAAPAHNDRVFLTEAQLFQARAQGALDRDVKSMLRVPSRMRYGDYRWDERNVPSGTVWVRVDLDRQLISVFRAGHEIGTAVILYGADEKETPSGVFPILAKIEDHESSTYDAKMPYTLRLTGDGVSIHASDVRWGAATHGCIGVPLAFAQKLFGQVSKGDQVVIVANERAA
jgi:hypothetical protein